VRLFQGSNVLLRRDRLIPQFLEQLLRLALEAFLRPCHIHLSSVQLGQLVLKLAVQLIHPVQVAARRDELCFNLPPAGDVAVSLAL
jgi:hypothetical protein